MLLEHSPPVRADTGLAITLTINGQRRELTVTPWTTLLDLLREKLDLTGTKIGCDQGECGACTVLVDGRPTLSCLLLAHEAEGCEVETIEGLAGPDGLHPLQQSFVDHSAVQCGFCTPGMILSALALLRQTPGATREEIREALSGNLCRCTGYTRIVAAVASVASRSTEVHGPTSERP